MHCQQTNSYVALLAADLAADLDIPLLDLQPSAHQASASSMVLCGEDDKKVLDVTEAVVHDQHAAWRRNMERLLADADDRTRWALANVMSEASSPTNTMNAVMALSTSQVAILHDPVREIVLALQTRVEERMRSLCEGKKAPRTYIRVPSSVMSSAAVRM